MLRVLTAVLFTLTSLMPMWQITPHQRMVARVQQSIVRVTDSPAPNVLGTCTGFVVLQDIVLTAEHCVGMDERADGVPAQVLAVSSDLDLAMLYVQTPKTPIRWAEVVPIASDPVTGLGYGYGKMTSITSQVREVNSVILAWRATPGLLVSPGWRHGMSGGPIVNQRGELVGMISAISSSGAYGIGPQAPDILEFVTTVIDNLPGEASPSVPPVLPSPP